MIRNFYFSTPLWSIASTVFSCLVLIGVWGMTLDWKSLAAGTDAQPPAIAPGPRCASQESRWTGHEKARDSEEARAC